MSRDESQMSTRISLLIRLRQEPVDEGAWDEFVRRYGGLILAWCQQWGLQAADADDVSQNVLLKLADHLRSFMYDPSRRFRGFLRTMAYNACKDYLDSRRRVVAASSDPGVHAVLGSVRRGMISPRGWRRPSTWSGSSRRRRSSESGSSRTRGRPFA